jgi:hypothetical protein
MSIRPMQSPLLGGMAHPFRRVITPTAEQRAEALTLTRAGATIIRDLCRELDLPADAFGVVAQLYLNQEWGVVQKAEAEREAKENAQRAELVKKLRDKRIRLEPDGGGGFTTGEYVDQFPNLGRRDGLDMLENSEILELAKKHGITVE